VGGQYSKIGRKTSQSLSCRQRGAKQTGQRGRNERVEGGVRSGKRSGSQAAKKKTKREKTGGGVKGAMPSGAKGGNNERGGEGCYWAAGENWSGRGVKKKTQHNLQEDHPRPDEQKGKWDKKKSPK